MNDIIEKLLLPAADNPPSGPDLSEKPEYEELGRLIKGKPEVEVGSLKKPAEPPDWREIKARSAEYLAQSKHLRVAALYCASSLQLAGLTGFRDGLLLIRGLLEQYWPTVHPLLDAEDNNDPTQRLNILGALNSPRGTLRPDTQQWLAFIDYLHATPLCRPKGAAPISLEMVTAAQLRGEGTPPAAGGQDLGQLKKAFAAAPPSELEGNLTAVSEALEAVTGIDQFLGQTLGGSNSIGFEEIKAVLKELQGVLKANVPGADLVAGVAGDPSAVDGRAQAAGGAAFSVTGAVRSREDVVRLIDSICEYYRQVEPSSPVPYLLRRAQKIALMNFVESMQELNLATVDAMRPSMGSTVDADPLSK